MILWWEVPVLTFNHKRKPFNVLGWSCLVNCFYEPADTQADHVVEDQQIHGGLNARVSFRHFEVNTEAGRISDERYVSGPRGVHGALKMLLFPRRLCQHA